MDGFWLSIALEAGGGVLGGSQSSSSPSQHKDQVCLEPVPGRDGDRKE